jgi:hypothetical protein
MPTSPWKPEYGGPVHHRDTEEIDEQRDSYPSGDIITVRCKVCGAQWVEELPQ